MKYAKLLHNPGAGEGDYDKKELVSMVQSAGFGCSYSSTKKEGWENFESKEIDFIILAGGDGTVRKLADSLLNKTLLDRKYPIALLPMGTANNIAKTLGIPLASPETVIKSWDERKTRKFDVGRIFGIKKNKFFLESFGVGLFPELMSTIRKQDRPKDLSPEESIQQALQTLRDLVEHAHARFCKITIDGVQHKGNYLMVEVMNTISMGPRLNIAPLADPSDGVFDVVLVSEKERDQFIEYIDTLIQGRDEVSFFNLLRAKKLEIFWDGSKAHVDDEIVDIKDESSIRIELLHGLLEFFTPENGSIKK
jgi:diacylglycerol kinase (ATP)